MVSINIKTGEIIEVEDLPIEIVEQPIIETTDTERLNLLLEKMSVATTVAQMRAAAAGAQNA